METIACNQCGESVLDTMNFCNNCGERLKCKECKSPILKGIKFCGECGLEIKKKNIDSAQTNTLSYHRNGDDIKCEVSLTNEVGKEGFKALVESIGMNSFQRPKALDAAENNETIDYILPASNLKNDFIEEINYKEAANNQTTIDKADQTDNPSEKEYPHIDDLISKRQFNEAEWVLIFAFYESNMGEI